MKNFFYNISSGNPKYLWRSSLASILDGLAKVFPAALLIETINVLYRHFEDPAVAIDTARLWFIAVFLLAWLIVEYIAYRYLYNNTYWAAYNVSAEGRLSFAEHIRHLSLGFFGKKDPGDLTNLLLSDYAQVETTISHYVPALISGVILPAFSFFGMLFINWKMSVAMFIALPFGALLLFLTDSIQGKLSASHVKAKNEAANRLEEYLIGIREIKAHNMGGSRFPRLDGAFHNLMKKSIRLEGLMGPLVMGAMLLVRSGMTIMIFAGSYLLIDGEINLPTFLLFIMVGSRVFEPLTVVLMNYAEIRYSVMSAKRIMDVKGEQEQGGTGTILRNQAISFENVVFGYDAQHPVIKNVSFTIEPNTITALVGPSGSGKSTITRLISRFWDVQSGKIKIGDAVIEETDPENILSDISMVFQDVYLFQDTIGNNIRIGKMNATQAEIEDAARRAQCHEFITQLPQGYDTLVGEGGSTLSGGEKQRISIARALLKDASIVLLDEATASLDPENEIAVQNAINELVTNKTVVLIAHRLKTIQNADKIVVLDGGEVAEIGTHDELIRSRGVYEKLWQMQKNAEVWQIH